MKRKHWRVNAENYANKTAKDEMFIRSVVAQSITATYANILFWGYAVGYRAAKRKGYGRAK